MPSRSPAASSPAAPRAPSPRSPGVDAITQVDPADAPLIRRAWYLAVGHGTFVAPGGPDEGGGQTETWRTSRPEGRGVGARSRSAAQPALACMFAEAPDYRALGTALGGGDDDAGDGGDPAGERFRWHFGPVFYRGRLGDDQVKVLVVGQDGGSDEALAHRSFVGESGTRVQHLLGQLGITRSYLFLNTFVYSILGQFGGALERLALDPASPVARHRNRLLDYAAARNDLRLIITVEAPPASRCWHGTAGGAAPATQARANCTASMGARWGRRRGWSTWYTGAAAQGSEALAGVTASFAAAAERVLGWAGEDPAGSRSTATGGGAASGPSATTGRRSLCGTRLRDHPAVGGGRHRHPAGRWAEHRDRPPGAGGRADDPATGGAAARTDLGPAVEPTTGPGHRPPTPGPRSSPSRGRPRRLRRRRGRPALGAAAIGHRVRPRPQRLAGPAPGRRRRSGVARLRRPRQAGRAHLRLDPATGDGSAACACRCWPTRTATTTWCGDGRSRARRASASRACSRRWASPAATSSCARCRSTPPGCLTARCGRWPTGPTWWHSWRRSPTGSSTTTRWPRW